MTTPPAGWAAARIPPPAPVLLRAAARHASATITPPGVAACLVRVLTGHATAVEAGADLDPHLIGCAVQTLNAALGPNWTPADTARHAHDGP